MCIQIKQKHEATKKHLRTCMQKKFMSIRKIPPTEEIRLEIFRSPDLPDFWVDLLSDGDSVYSRKNLFDNLGACLICTRTPVTTCWKCWQS